MTAVHDIHDPALLAREPLVSVVMLAYRHERFLEEAIEGVAFQQSDFPFELIVGEDCSPDGTRDVALALQRKYPGMIRLLTSDANVGGKANLARCLAVARGAYIAICEGDDYWCDPSKLMRQMTVFRTTPDCHLVFHAAKIVDAEDGRAIGMSRWSHHSRRFTTEELVLGDGGMVPTASILLRRSVFDERRSWALDAPVSDYPLVLSAALAGDVIYLDRCMSVYRSNVPHSWTRRHVRTLSHRMGYARATEAMLRGFSSEAPFAARAASAMISKYYSDAIVHSDASLQERRLAYTEVSSQLRGSDRLLGWLASRFGLRLKRTKILIRQGRTLLRLGKAQLRRDLSWNEPP